MTTTNRAPSHGHPCPAPGCGEDIPRYHFACSDHWYSIPAGLRQKVREAWWNIRNDPLHYAHARAEAIDFLDTNAHAS